MMAKSERRMNVGAAASFACSLAWGWFTARYVTDTSASVAINLVLIWVQWGLLLLAGCWAGLRLSSLLFGTPWRARVLLGEPVPTDLTEEGLVQGFSENRAPFFGLLACAILLSWGAVQLATNNYLTRYNTEGYFATMLRSESPAEQVAALWRARRRDPCRPAGARTGRLPGPPRRYRGEVMGHLGCRPDGNPLR
jgi:hypothetical protein